MAVMQKIRRPALAGRSSIQVFPKLTPEGAQNDDQQDKEHQNHSDIAAYARRNDRCSRYWSNRRYGTAAAVSQMMTHTYHPALVYVA
ncbi:hypothetical protein J21TS3_26450 [Paenibacillus cookii]|jgi:hypothetical protein|uniref:Uncharacterized protein n=1 Tax=Paenibacillus cookii TaxID=157839 RepID=A0ABQ4LX17_9BACL|nr:hypothetical protein J21TS3_26450 [Paenibacillus cookii]